MKVHRFLCSLVTGACLASFADAQSFNIDFGYATPFGVPSNAYGAAAEQPGYWNSINFFDIHSPVRLSDLNGNPTTVRMETAFNTYLPGHFSQDNPGTHGGDERLMDDTIEVGYYYFGDESLTFFFYGLEPGDYEVYAYSMAPENNTTAALVILYIPGGSSAGWCGGIWPGHHEQGISYRRSCGKLLIAGSSVAVRFSLDHNHHGNSYGPCNGIQIVKRQYPCGEGEPGTRYCFGDPGPGTPCPCGNDNDGSVPGSGCDNGIFASGARLDGFGEARVSSDTVMLSTTHQEPSNTGLYFQAVNDLSPGFLWGDGLRCAGGGEIRLQVCFSDATGSSHTDIPIAQAGGVSAGDIRYYQFWYRTSVNPPCGIGVHEFNTTNGLEIAWSP